MRTLPRLLLGACVGLLIAGLLGGSTFVARASSSGSVELNGRVAGPPPRSAAVITQPKNSQKFKHSLVTISGTCPNGSFVQIYRNGVFAGSVQCIDKKFSLKIELAIGKNTLQAKVFDNLGQFGPNSAIVTVYYQLVSSTGQINPQLHSPGSPSKQLLLSVESLYHGVKAGQTFAYKLTVTGGKPPYAVIVKWGNDTESVFARPHQGQFRTDYTYQEGGIYNVLIKATDGAGNQALLQTVMLVNGTPRALPSGAATVFRYFSPLNIIWPFYLLLVVLIFGFWLGRLYQSRKQKKSADLQKTSGKHD